VSARAIGWYAVLVVVASLLYGFAATSWGAGYYRWRTNAGQFVVTQTVDCWEVGRYIGAAVRARGPNDVYVDNCTPNPLPVNGSPFTVQWREATNNNLQTGANNTFVGTYSGGVLPPGDTTQGLGFLDSSNAWKLLLGTFLFGFGFGMVLRLLRSSWAGWMN